MQLCFAVPGELRLTCYGNSVCCISLSVCCLSFLFLTLGCGNLSVNANMAQGQFLPRETAAEVYPKLLPIGWPFIGGILFVFQVCQVLLLIVVTMIMFLIMAFLSHSLTSAFYPRPFSCTILEVKIRHYFTLMIKIK